MLLAVPIARFFHYPQLAVILPVASLFFVFTGFNSTARALVQKQLKVARVSHVRRWDRADRLVAHVTMRSSRRPSGRSCSEASSPARRH